MTDPGRRRTDWLRLGALVAVFGVTLAFAFGLGTWLAVRATVRASPEVEVPDVIGVDSAAAEERLRAAGLAPEIAARRADATHEAGRVVQQYPGPGSATRPGRPVRLVVSLGTRRVTVPDLAGSNAARAVAALRAAGLEPGPSAEAPEPGTARGRVVGQHPPAGAEAAPGERVALLLSAGPRPELFVMPDVVGRPGGAVAAALARRGFRRVRVSGPAAAPVAVQQPRAGYPVATGDEIVLTTGQAGGTT